MITRAMKKNIASRVEGSNRGATAQDKSRRLRGRGKPREPKKNAKNNPRFFPLSFEHRGGVAAAMSEDTVKRRCICLLREGTGDARVECVGKSRLWIYENPKITKNK